MTALIPKMNKNVQTIETLPKEPRISIQPVNLKKLDKFKVPKEIENIAHGGDLSKYEKMIPRSKTDEHTYFELTKACLHLEECAESAPLHHTDLRFERLKKIGKTIFEVQIQPNFDIYAIHIYILTTISSQMYKKYRIINCSKRSKMEF